MSLKPDSDAAHAAIDYTHTPDARGRFGDYGGSYVSETLIAPLAELTAEYEKLRVDPAFIAEADKLRLPVSPKTGDEALKVVEGLYAVPDSLVAEAKKVVTQ